MSGSLRFEDDESHGGPSRGVPVAVLIRLALRSLRAGLSGFGVFLACIALGVGAITGVGSISRGFSDGLAAQSRVILGGDAAFSVMHRPLDDAAVAWLASKGRVSTVASARAMARRAPSAGRVGAAALIDLQAVDGAWPSLGAATIRPNQPIVSLLAEKDGVYGLIADPALAARLRLAPGARLKIGDETFELRGTLLSQPDALAGGFDLGPRVIVSLDALKSSGLLQPGALVRWTYRVVLPEASAANPTALVRSADAAFPKEGWETRTREKVSPQFAASSKQLTQFLSLVALTALMVGGIGVANAARAHVDRKLGEFAALKAIGASGGAVFAMAFLQIMAVATIGSLIGLAIGAALPFAVAWGVGAIVQLPYQPAVYPGELAIGLVYGLLSAVGFATPPLGRAHDAPVAALFRARAEPDAHWPRPRYVAISAAAFAVFAAVALFGAADRRIAEFYLLASLAAVVVLRALAAAIMWAARKAPRIGPVELKLAIANLHRPGALTSTMVLSLGLGLALLVAVTFIDGNLRREIGSATPGRTPDLFILDAPSDGAAGFAAFIRSNAPDAKLQQAPMLRGRVTALNGKAVRASDAPSSAAWVLQGDRGLTYSATPPAAARLVAGRWWAPDYSGPPLVSMDAAIAAALKLKLGETVTVNVLGRDVTAKIANLRDVDWRSLGINFVFVFSPNALQGAPHTQLATVSFPPSVKGEPDLALLTKIADAYPATSIVRVKDALSAANALLDKVALAIRCASAVVLSAAALVLAGAIASGQRNRLYDSVVLKTLGATRRQLIVALTLEYVLLGSASALVGMAAGGFAARLILEHVLDVAFFTWIWGAAAAAAAIGLTASILLGLTLTWRALGRKPSTLLRDL